VKFLACDGHGSVRSFCFSFNNAPGLTRRVLVLAIVKVTVKATLSTIKSNASSSSAIEAGIIHRTLPWVALSSSDGSRINLCGHCNSHDFSDLVIFKFGTITPHYPIASHGFSDQVIFNPWASTPHCPIVSWGPSGVIPFRKPQSPGVFPFHKKVYPTVLSKRSSTNLLQSRKLPFQSTYHTVYPTLCSGHRRKLPTHLCPSNGI
jgi:hypothetical protein